MNEGNQEKELLRTKLDSLKSLVATLQEQTDVLKKDRKFKKSSVLEAKPTANESLIDLSEKAKNAPRKVIPIRKKAIDERLIHRLGKASRDVAKHSTLDGARAIEGKDLFNNSSERLSQLAKATWKARTNLSDNSKRFSEIKKHMFPQNIKSLRDQLWFSNKKMSVEKSSVGLQKFAPRNNVTTFNDRERTNMKMNYDFSNSPKEASSNVVLDLSSERLSSLARSTWQSSQIKKLKSQITVKNALKDKVSNHLAHRSSLKSNKYKANKFFEFHDYKNALPRVYLDLSTDISWEDRPMASDSNDDSTNTRLSKLAKSVWSRKVKSKTGNNLIGRRFNLERNFRQHGKVNISNKARSINQSNYSWKATHSKNKSFLRRRSSVILKQNRFCIIKRSKPFSHNEMPFSRSHNAFVGNTPPKNMQRKTRNSFIYRRQAFLYTHVNDPKKSTNLHHSSIYTKSNLHRPIKQKAAKESKILFNISGRKFQTDIKGRKLRRISASSGSRATGLKVGNSAVLHASKPKQISHHGNKYKFVRRQNSRLNNVTKLVASRVVKKSVVRLQQHKIRKLVKKQYCMFYNRFGKCKNGEKCRYKHDPEKIAVCTRFLRGTCKEENCLFSHKIDRDKMPTCSFFLRGSCHRDDCPYSHVKVSVDADICKDFVRGHCPNGDKCLKKHILECSMFMKTGHCPDGKNCKLYHPKRGNKKRGSFSGTRTPLPFLRKTRLMETENDQKGKSDLDKEVTLQIKPAFLTAQSPEKSRISSPRRNRKRTFDWKKDTEEFDNLSKKMLKFD